MRKTKKKTNRVITLFLALVLVLGSLHWVAADEQAAPYDAPELILAQGMEEYDLTEGIAYDSDHYTLQVVDLGGFDIWIPGEYEVTYALIPREEPPKASTEPSSEASSEAVESSEARESSEIVESSEADTSGETDAFGEASAVPGENTEGGSEAGAESTAPEEGTGAGENTESGSGATGENTGSETAGEGGESAPLDTTGESSGSETASAGSTASGDADTPQAQSGSGESASAISETTAQAAPASAEGIIVQSVSVEAATYNVSAEPMTYSTMSSGEEAAPAAASSATDNPQAATASGENAASNTNTPAESSATDAPMETAASNTPAESGVTDVPAESVASNTPAGSEVSNGSTESGASDVPVAAGSSEAPAESAEAPASKETTELRSVIYFTRQVIVLEAIMPMNLLAPVALNTGNVQLGNAVYVSGSTTQFTYPYLRVLTTDAVGALTVTVTDGTLDITDVTKGNDCIEISDTTNTSTTWIFTTMREAGAVQTMLRQVKITGTAATSLEIVVDANPTTGDFATVVNNGGKLTYHGGYYYLFVNDTVNWVAAYNGAKSLTLGGRKGYLATVSDQAEVNYLKKLTTKNCYLGGTSLLNSDGSKIADVDSLDGHALKYAWESRSGEGRLDRSVAASYLYWADGPQQGTTMSALSLTWSNVTEPNNQNVGEPTAYGAGNLDLVDIKTYPNINTYETCVMIIVNGTQANGEGLNDIFEGNWHPGGGTRSEGYYVKFGGYADGTDPGGRDEDLCSGVSETVGTVYTAEAQIGNWKYATVKDVIAAASAGDTVEIIKDTVTAAKNILLPEDVTLKDTDGNTYQALLDLTYIDISSTGAVTLKEGKLEISNEAPLSVYDPVDSETYLVVTPDCTSTILVDDQGDHPYLVGDSDGTVKIGNVSYTYENQSPRYQTLVYIPHAMAQNDQVKKAEVAADQTAVIKLDEGATDSVTLNGGGLTSDTVVLERRASDNKVDVTLPSGTTATAFGHGVTAVPTGGVIISQQDATDPGYPGRDYITIPTAGERVTVDGITYTAEQANQKFYLGTFTATLYMGTDAEIEGGAQPTNPGYHQPYSVTFSPKANYDLEADAFVVTMKASDTGAVQTLDNADVCSTAGDGKVTVAIPKVTGDLTITVSSSRQQTALRVNGLTSGNGQGKLTATDPLGQTYDLTADGAITVNRNEVLTLTFTPNDFQNPFYSDLTGERGESFSILTALTEAIAGNADLFAGATFDWTEKSYTLTYTPTTAAVTLNATFTPSHIAHVHVTGGTGEVTGVKDSTGGAATLLRKETGADAFQHVIVPQGGTVNVTLTDTTGNNPVYKTATWGSSDLNSTATPADVTAGLTGTGPTYTYTTAAVSAPEKLNVSFSQGQPVEITVTGGTLENHTTWTDGGNGTYTKVVPHDSALTIKVAPEADKDLQKIEVNGYDIDLEGAKKTGDLVWNAQSGTYSHTFAKVDQTWKITVVFAAKKEVQFQNQNGTRLFPSETICVVEGHTIPQTTFTRMQVETDKLKGAKESFFVWQDTANGNKVYNAYSQITGTTPNPLVLSPVYREKVAESALGARLAGEAFVIHVNSLGSLEEAMAKTLAGITAYDKDGNNVTTTVAVNPDDLLRLKGSGVGTYPNALTFTLGTASIQVTVEITDANPVITGKTAHTLTFVGVPNTAYSVEKLDNGGNPTGTPQTFTTDGNGKATAINLDKATQYRISNTTYGSTTGKTSLVDAEDIARQFAADTNDTTDGNHAKDTTESAWNSNVIVTVDEDGNYKVTLKQDVNRSVDIPDTWEDVSLDLNGHTIQGEDATDSEEAKPGLSFVKDGTLKDHPGTHLTIKDSSQGGTGAIQGGNGSAAHPDGAAGVTGSTEAANAALTVTKPALIQGGKGADALPGSMGGSGSGSTPGGSTPGTNGGAGGAGIHGAITPTIKGGTVIGGNGGNGADTANGTPGAGGAGGAGIQTKKQVIVTTGTVTGGNGGAGGHATGTDGSNGGAGGIGGTGIDSKEDILIGPGTSTPTIHGGAGGAGGDSSSGNGGSGGTGGTGTDTEGRTENKGGSISGGSGGPGGDADKGNGGNGGAGGNGSKGNTDNTGGAITGGDGGNGGDGGAGKQPGNGGAGGNGSTGNGSDGSKGNTGSNSGGGSGGGNDTSEEPVKEEQNPSQAHRVPATPKTEEAQKEPEPSKEPESPKPAEEPEEAEEELIPADSSGEEELHRVGFLACSFHWYPLALLLLLASYTIARVRKIRQALAEDSLEPLEALKKTQKLCIGVTVLLGAAYVLLGILLLTAGDLFLAEHCVVDLPLYGVGAVLAAGCITLFGIHEGKVGAALTEEESTE